MSQTLSDYITECRRLLHDANGNFYSDSELTDYINDARKRLVRDTGCLRKIQTVTAVTSQEVYTFLTDFPQAMQTMDVLNINLYWGNTRVPMRYLPWTQFNASLRYTQNYIGQPIAFSNYGQSKFYLGPVPGQIYVLELDTVITPLDLVNSSDVDEISVRYQSPVALRASHEAKYQEQSYGEAEIFEAQYRRELFNVINTAFTRRIPNPYSTPY
jgi:hypothetical protein